MDDRVGELVARFVQLPVKILAAAGQQVDDLLAGLADVLGDGLAAARQQVGYALGRAVGGP